uniref:uncharacterized protein LOC124033761 isoform X3 n=1 Tax=Oncorhynchus gorbuscha TaxID=8017 RepID=UPI001EAF18D2|nr:uncharacterized protein LOC124033761 isoform X3 [Oncorhynchus gorbuscha]XP_046201961.1 uncharacterized protein LOC124033761 isoform X3 [Oncorhynchus gorbuscha]XP_046201962.1 uncharacterized protein LOC124033761 isoform X3 [Oncorhynchus gorbuscha]XP_046201963.1 uncharacterized protein LOC124033761 isoform X3 [Oncorhynchus gorbuscha]
MTKKDRDKLTQLQELHQLESKVKQLTDQVMSSEETIGQLRQEVAVRVGISSATLSGDGSTTNPTGSSPVPHLTEQRGRELLKTELSCRDATIQRLRRDVLLSPPGPRLPVCSAGCPWAEDLSAADGATGEPTGAPEGTQPKRAAAEGPADPDTAGRGAPHSELCQGQRGHRECPGRAEVCGPGGGADRDPSPETKGSLG